jgi:hypothetical protein
VTASGSAPLLYQWYKTNPLSAATSSSYTITGLVLTNAGGFYVTITNDFGSVTSSVATLTVTNTVSGGGSPPPGNTNAITLHFGTINAVHVGQ